MRENRKLLREEREEGIKERMGVDWIETCTCRDIKYLIKM